MITTDELRALSLFEKVAEPELERLIAVGSEVTFSPGDELWAQNLPADAWWVLLEGRVDLVRLVGREETVLGAMAPGRWAGGFRAWDEHAVYLATGRATTAGRVLRVAAEDLKTGPAPRTRSARTSSRASSAPRGRSRPWRASARPWCPSARSPRGWRTS